MLCKILCFRSDKKDGKGKPSGALAGDPTLRSIQKQLREAVGGVTITATGSTLSNLSQIGIGRDNDGRLTPDRVVLDERLKADSRGLEHGPLLRRLARHHNCDGNAARRDYQH
ncbi:MAG: flagellar filament capping protein FliD [Pyrinomonadaceae bacterium]